MKTTLIIDYNNLAMRNFFIKDIGFNTEEPNFNLWRYNVFDQIYYAAIRFRPVNEVIIAVDSKDTWRKLYYPPYKSNRKKDDDINWEQLYMEMDNFQKLLKENIPWKVIKASRSEADDIIAVLSNYIDNEKVVIVSNDVDFVQLSSDKIKVYNPSKKEIVDEPEDKENYINTMALCGQSKDNIYNCKTPIDYPDSIRKPPLGKKTAKKILEEGIDEFLDKEISINKEEYEKKLLPRVRFDQNKVLIDFRNIPKVIKDVIKKEYNNYTLPNPEGFYSFFENMGWNEFLEKFDLAERTLMYLY